VIGNVFGCAIFAAFTVMGHKTGVNQMVLSRSAFAAGRVSASLLMFLMTLGLDRGEHLFPGQDLDGILSQFWSSGIPLTIFTVITLVMVVQVAIGIYGFYAIARLKKYTVPVTVVINGADDCSRWSQPGVVNWNLTSTLPPSAHVAMLTLLMSAIGSAGEFPG